MLHHRCRHKEDPTVERDTTRQGHVVCFGRINRPREGLRCYEGGHRKSQRTIDEDGRSAMVCGHSAPHDEVWTSPACQGSPYTRGRGTRPACAPSPCPMIRKENRSVTPTHPTMGILTLRKVTVQRQLVVPSSSSDDDFSLVKHDARVDLNPGNARIHYTQEPALVSDSPPLSPLCYIVSRQ
jgi:hypothetical protein